MLQYRSILGEYLSFVLSLIFIEIYCNGFQELKVDVKKFEYSLDEKNSKETHLQQRLKQLDQEETHNVKRLEEISNISFNFFFT